MKLLSLWFLVGCNQAGLTPNSDGSADLRSDFCTGQARAELNGMRADSAGVMGRIDGFSCCDGAEFDVISMQLAEPLFFTWQHQVSALPELPATVDLANLPKGWAVRLYSGCSPFWGGVCSPTDMLTEGFSGSLSVDGNPSSGYQMSVCLTASETTAHPVLHSAKIWSPTLTAK